MSFYDEIRCRHRRAAARRVPLDDGLESADVAVIITAHPAVDHEAIAKRSPLTVDLRGVTRRLGLESARRL